MYPGGFNTRYGGAVGGVVEIKGREAQKDRWHGMIDVNLLESSMMVEGPLTDKIGFQAAGRYSYIGPAIEAATKDDWDNVGKVARAAVARLTTA